MMRRRTEESKCAPTSSPPLPCSRRASAAATSRRMESRSTSTTRYRAWSTRIDPGASGSRRSVQPASRPRSRPARACASIAPGATTHRRSRRRRPTTSATRSPGTPSESPPTSNDRQEAEPRSASACARWRPTGPRPSAGARNSRSSRPSRTCRSSSATRDPARHACPRCGSPSTARRSARLSYRAAKRPTRPRSTGPTGTPFHSRRPIPPRRSMTWQRSLPWSQTPGS